MRAHTHTLDSEMPKGLLCHYEVTNDLVCNCYIEMECVFEAGGNRPYNCRSKLWKFGQGREKKTHLVQFDGTQFVIFAEKQLSVNAILRCLFFVVAEIITRLFFFPVCQPETNYHFSLLRSLLGLVSFEHEQHFLNCNKVPTNPPEIYMML